LQQVMRVACGRIGTERRVNARGKRDCKQQFLHSILSWEISRQWLKGAMAAGFPSGYSGNRFARAYAISPASSAPVRCREASALAMYPWEQK
jgi:hypothetical protein